MNNNYAIEDLIDFSKLWDDNLSEDEIDEIVHFMSKKERRPPIYSVGCYDDDTDEVIEHCLVLEHKKEHNYRCWRCEKPLCEKNENEMENQYSTIMCLKCDCACEYKFYIGKRYEYND